jgi:hypothetical protein
MSRIPKALLIAVLAALLCACPRGARGYRILDAEGDAGVLPAFTGDGSIVAGCYVKNDPKRIMFALSGDGGKKWKIQEIGFPGKPRIILSPHAAISDGTVYAAFYESGSKAIWLMAASEGNEPILGKVCTLDGEEFGSLGLAINGNIAHVAYGTIKTGILYYASVALVPMLSAGPRIVIDDTATSKGALNPSISCTRDEVYIAYGGSYHGIGKGTSLRLAFSRDAGATWIKEDRQTLDGPECSMGRFPDIENDVNGLTIAYLSHSGVKMASSAAGGPWRSISLPLADTGKGGLKNLSLARDARGFFVLYMRDGWLCRSDPSKAEKVLRIDPRGTIKDGYVSILTPDQTGRIMSFAYEPEGKDLVFWDIP